MLNLPYMPSTYLFLTGASDMAQLDIFNGRSLWAGIGLFKSEPVNTSFSDYGFESNNYLPNSGSIFILQCGIVFFYIFKFALSMILAKRCGKHKAARQIGIWATEKSMRTSFLRAQRKLFMEGYFIISLCVVLTIYGFSPESYSGINLFNLMLAGASAIALVFYPIIGWMRVWANQDSLQAPRVRAMLSPFLSNIRVKNHIALRQNFYFMLRRVLTAAVLVYMSDLPFFQCAILMIISTMSLIFLIAE